MAKGTRAELEALRDELGKRPDRELAERAGVSRALVVKVRKELGIPAFDPEAAKVPRPFYGRRSLLDTFRDVIGQVPDAVVAARAGCSVENVRTWRRRRGIAAPPATAPATEAVDADALFGAPKGTHQVWEFTFERGEGDSLVQERVFVVAEWFEAAVLKASAHAARFPGGRVTGLVQIGKLLAD